MEAGVKEMKLQGGEGSWRAFGVHRSGFAVRRRSQSAFGGMQHVALKKAIRNLADAHCAARLTAPAEG
jgi:hypothetical protein